MAVKRTEKNTLGSATANGVRVEVPDLNTTPAAEETQTEETQTEETTPVAETSVTPPESGEEQTQTEDTTSTEGSDSEPETAEDPTEESAAEEEPSVPEVQIPTDPTPAPSGVTVDPESLNVKEDNIPTPPEGKVRIRMRVDHHCVIAMERYDFKAGQTYLVPQNVKNIMNKKGYLSPL